MTTIYDIAKRAGVSAATVSKALNGYADVSVRTREKVLQITGELGYVPNASARGLVTKRSMLVGVFLNDPTNGGLLHPFFQDVVASFKDVIGAKGYDLVFFAATHVTHMDYVDRARERGVDGLLLFGIPISDPGLQELVASGIPCISIDLELLGSRAGYVISDNSSAAREVVRYLYSIGHRQIGYVGAYLPSRPGHDRMLGYNAELTRLGLQVRSEWVVEGDYGEQSGYVAMEKILAAPELPTAVFFSGDMMAIGGMMALRSHGLKPGVDMSVVGFDDINLARYVRPGLTTVRQKREEMGATAARELLSLIENPNQPPRVVTLETELVVRESVRNLVPVG